MKKTNMLPNSIQSHQPGRKKRPGLQCTIRLFGVLFFLSIFGAACTAQQPAFPTGDFVNGQERITFKPDGTYTVWLLDIDSSTIEDGRYSIDGSQITLQDEVCDPAVGTYTWDFDGEKLIFEYVKEACDARKWSLLDRKWFIQTEN